MTRPTGPWRVTEGEAIDRSTPIPFRFDGRSYTGLAGDTLASALLANGIRVVARSFKFHRPRGIYSCGVEEPNALLEVDSGARAVPSERAPVIELTEALGVHSQQGWPSVNFDIGRALSTLAPLWAAGFYNKTFIWPSWHIYEPLIRRMAGLGHAPREPDPDRYGTGNLCCDALIVGGGLAGLNAALTFGRSGARVILVEQDHTFGGAAAWDGTVMDGAPAGPQIAAILPQLAELADVRLMSRTTATGVYDHNVVALLERLPRPENGAHTAAPRERYWIIRAARIVLATGAIEQPLIFANNDRSGIMLAGAAREYLRRYGVAIGRRVVVATNNDSAYALATDLKGAGVEVLGVADSRRQVPESLRAALQAAAVPLFTGSTPIDTSGFSHLRSMTLGRLSPDGLTITSSQRFKCDALAVSGGFNPTLHLYAQAGGKLAYDELSGSLSPVTPLPDLEIVGVASEKIPIGPRVSPVGDPKRKFVDLLHDVTVADLELALRENYTAVEHVKRYTTVGMAADQGKTSAPAALGILGSLRAIRARDLGHTTLRPPFSPVTLGAIAGRETGERFAPHRLLPMHDWHVAHGALIQDIGEWRRPVVYLRSGEGREQAVRREALAVRAAVGLFDGSSLGKIEILGPDALTFLDRFYINDLTTLKPHRVRYGLLLRESGIIFDDGTAVRLADDRFLITTTSGNAGRVGQWLEQWHQCEWPQLRVAIVPVTDAWATLSLAGPLARQVLAKVDPDIPLATEAFPHLMMREATIRGVPARIYRVSFSGELTYEINIPTDHGPALWVALMEMGAQEGICPFGLDALMLMRLEKGFLHLGTDTDGTTVPDDVGYGKVAASKKADFIGKRSLRLPEHVKADRLQLIGLAGNADKPFTVGSHLRIRDSHHPTDGWITSAGTATLTNEPIALAVLRGGRARIGAQVEVYDFRTRVGAARVVAPPFYDPTGDRMNA
jgi:sarcosine oxidase subunit alpha